MTAVPAGVVRALRGAVLVLSAVLVAFFVDVVVQRFRYPVELEWMSGTSLDTVERVLQGKPIYAEPSAAWIPFMYPPLYFWISAVVARALPLLTACRLVSIGATLASAALVARTARALGAGRFWSAVAVGCFFGAYALTGTWYDIERADVLCVAMLLGGVLVAIEARSAASVAAGGALLGLAFFAKQPALIVTAGTCAGLAVAGRRGHAVALAAGAAAVLLPLAAWLHVTTGGWWDFYCIHMGAKHGVDPSLIPVFLVGDLSKAFLFSAATFALLGWLVRDVVARARARAAAAAEPGLTVFACALGAAFVSSGMSRLHVGGWLNVLVFWSSFACVAVAVVGERVERLARETTVAHLVASGLALGVFLQLLHLAYDPGEASPNPQRVIDASIVAAKVHELEKSGEVVLTGRGHVTEPRHFHLAALGDVLRGGRGVPEDLARALDERRYAAYVVDEWGELGLEGLIGHRSDLFDRVVANYYVAERFDDREPPPIVGWTAHPSWIMKPRKRPLVGLSYAELERHRVVEVGLVEARMREAQAGVVPAPDAPSVEDLAEAALRRDAAAERATK